MNITPDQWFAIARDCIMMGVAALVFYWGRDRQQTSDSVKVHFDALEAHLTATDQRLEKAGERSSRLATMVQGLVGRLDRLPEELREKRTFCSHETVELLISKAIRDKGAGL